MLIDYLGRFALLKTLPPSLARPPPPFERTLRSVPESLCTFNLSNISSPRLLPRLLRGSDQSSLPSLTRPAVVGWFSPQGQSNLEFLSTFYIVWCFLASKRVLLLSCVLAFLFCTSQEIQRATTVLCHSTFIDIEGRHFRFLLFQTWNLNIPKLSLAATLSQLVDSLTRALPQKEFLP